MAYLRCETCGSKALSAASQCPRCAAPFDLTDGRGFRAALKKCGGCGIMHRRDRSCHWCGDRSVPAWRSAKVLSSAAAIAVMALAGVGAYTYRAPLRETASLIVARALAPAPQANAAPVGSSSATQSAVQSATQPATQSRDASEVSATSASIVSAPDASVAIDSVTTAPAFDPGTMIASAPDSIRWIPAVARTWVNVRNDASRDGNVVGVINPASRAMLGTTRAGWRQVKSTEVTGWVDPRLFEPDSLRTRG